MWSLTSKAFQGQHSNRVYRPSLKARLSLANVCVYCVFGLSCSLFVDCVITIDQRPRIQHLEQVASFLKHKHGCGWTQTDNKNQTVFLTKTNMFANENRALSCTYNATTKLAIFRQTFVDENISKQQAAARLRRVFEHDRCSCFSRRQCGRRRRVSRHRPRRNVRTELYFPWHWTFVIRVRQMSSAPRPRRLCGRIFGEYTIHVPAHLSFTTLRGVFCTNMSCRSRRFTGLATARFMSRWNEKMSTGPRRKTAVSILCPWFMFITVGILHIFNQSIIATRSWRLRQRGSQTSYNGFRTLQRVWSQEPRNTNGVFQGCCVMICTGGYKWTRHTVNSSQERTRQ